MIAGGLADGTVLLWNPATIINSTPGNDDVQGAVLAKLQQHANGVCISSLLSLYGRALYSQVKGLAFNSHTPNLLASGGGDGELCIWDVANPNAPSLFPDMKVGGVCCRYSHS